MKGVTLLLWLLLLSGCGEVVEPEPLSSAGANLILDTRHGGDGSAWGLPQCSACHPLTQIHRHADHIRDIAAAKGYGSCTGCHGRNGSQESEPRRCLICHNGDDLPRAPLQSGRHAHDFDANADLAASDEQCLACHVAADMNGHFDLNRDLTRYPDRYGQYGDYTNVAAFCLRCHNRDHQQPGFEIGAASFDDPLIAIEDDFHYVDQHGEVDGRGSRSYAGLRPAYRYQSVVACTDCHAMHGTDNAKLIIDNSLKGVSLLQPALRQSGYTVDVEGGNHAQLCVLCHAMDVVVEEGAEDAGNGLSGVHQVTADCRPCHRHGEAVQAGL